LVADPFLCLVEHRNEPAKEFETTLRPIVKRWDPPPSGKDPYNDKLLVVEAINKLQKNFDRVMKQLEDLSDAELVEPVTTPG
jgi:hypothetical protein